MYPVTEEKHLLCKSSLDCREIMRLQCFNIGSFSMKMEHEKMALFFSTFTLMGKPHGGR